MNIFPSAAENATNMDIFSENAHSTMRTRRAIRKMERIRKDSHNSQGEEDREAGGNQLR
jgi:hypothetical protein